MANLSDDSLLVLAADPQVEDVGMFEVEEDFRFGITPRERVVI